MFFLPKDLHARPTCRSSVFTSLCPSYKSVNACDNSRGLNVGGLNENKVEESRQSANKWFNLKVTARSQKEHIDSYSINVESQSSAVFHSKQCHRCLMNLLANRTARRLTARVTDT